MPDQSGSAGCAGSATARSRSSDRRPLSALTVAALLLVLPSRRLPGQPDLAALRSLEEMQWGVRAFHAGSFASAILSFERAIALHPENLLARQWLGRSLYRDGLEREALAEWRFVAARGGGGALLAALAETVASRRSVDNVLSPDARYSLLSTLGAADRRDPPIGKPSSVRGRRDGTFYVVPYTGTQILRFDANFAIVQVVRGGLQGFNRPFDIIETDQGELFVSEYGADQIARCSLSGQKLATFGGSGVEPGKLIGPQYLADDGKGYLYVSEYGNRRVSKFDYEGRFILTIGTRGAGFTGLEEPAGIAVQDGLLYVADRARGVLQVFDLSGNYIGPLARLREPEGVHAAGVGRLLVAQKDSIVFVDTRRETATPLAEPFPRVQRILGVALDANGDVLAADFDGGKVLLFGKSDTLFAGLFVQIERVSAERFPEVIVDVSVTDRAGSPVLGLKRENFVVSERFAPVRDLQLAIAAAPARPLYAMLLVEKSAAMRIRSAELGRAVEELHRELDGGASLGLVTAGRQAVVAIPSDARRLALREAAVAEDWSDDWRLDQGVRLAAAQLVSSRARTAVVLVSTGSIGRQPYARYSLMELAQHLRNNHVSFHVLLLGSESAHADLEFLAARTGGSVASIANARRVRPVAEAVKAWMPPLYTLKYASASDGDFGRSYIDVQVDATQQRRAGRDEAGYYAPRQY